MVLESGGVKNGLKAVQDPSFEEKRSIDEPDVILRVNRVSIQMRNFLNASHSRMMRLQRAKKDPHHEELQVR